MEHRIKIVSAHRLRPGNADVWIGQGCYFASYRGERIGEFRSPETESARWLIDNAHAAPDDAAVVCRDGWPCRGSPANSPSSRSSRPAADLRSRGTRSRS